MREVSANLPANDGAPATRPNEPAIAPPVDHDAHVLSLAGVMLARFFTEAAPANAAKAIEDPLGRRGLALYLAGAASELAIHLDMPAPGDLMANVTPPVLQETAKEVLAEARALAAADNALMAAGRTGMRNYVGAAEERPSMAGALVDWYKAARAEAQTSPLFREAQAS